VNSSIPLQVIAIDNGSTDGTPELIRRRYPQVQVVENPSNLGFGKANNIGIKAAYEAGAHYVFLLNQDAWVEPGTLEKLIDVAARSPEYGIISPVHLNGAGDAFDYGFLNYLCGNESRGYVSDLYLKPREELAEIYQLDFINAACWLLPRNTIEIVGGFNPIFFQYGEDQDYVNRCHYFHLKVGFTPYAKAYHGRTQYDSEVKRGIVLHTSALAKLLDPRGTVGFYSHIASLVKSIINSLLRFRFSQAGYFFSELAYYFSNKARIRSISAKIKTPGLNFLD
jgi:GT2 family glycosyltransferase